MEPIEKLDIGLRVTFRTDANGNTFASVGSVQEISLWVNPFAPEPVDGVETIYDYNLGEQHEAN